MKSNIKKPTHCPNCRSSRITAVLDRGYLIITCQRCGYQNRRLIDNLL